MQCANHFKQVGVALHNYHAAHTTFPPGVIVWTGSTPAACGPRGETSYYAGWSWGAFLLPFLERSDIYDMIDFTELKYFDLTSHHAGTSTNTLASTSTIETFVCPSDPQGPELVAITGGGSFDTSHPDADIRKTNMTGVADSVDFTCGGGFPKQLRQGTPPANGIMAEREGCRIRDVTDGTSNTLCVGEVAGGEPGSHMGHLWASWNINDTADGINGPSTIPGGGIWQPGGAYGNARDHGFSSYHPGGCHFLMADGSVQFLDQMIESTTLAYLTTRSGGETVQSEWIDF